MKSGAIYSLHPILSCFVVFICSFKLSSVFCLALCALVLRLLFLHGGGLAPSASRGRSSLDTFVSGTVVASSSSPIASSADISSPSILWCRCFVFTKSPSVACFHPCFAMFAALCALTRSAWLPSYSPNMSAYAGLLAVVPLPVTLFAVPLGALGFCESGQCLALCPSCPQMKQSLGLSAFYGLVHSAEVCPILLQLAHRRSRRSRGGGSRRTRAPPPPPAGPMRGPFPLWNFHFCSIAKHSWSPAFALFCNIIITSGGQSS